MRGDFSGAGRDIFKSTPNLIKDAAVGGAGGDDGVDRSAACHGNIVSVRQATVAPTGTGALSSERHQAASPVGHG